ncbi:MAG: hypothetical protein K2K45_05235 [Muribaculaceae bacterium]|nr:hypothetical protein [Muribaculaceae bacterium]
MAEGSQRGESEPEEGEAHQHENPQGVREESGAQGTRDVASVGSVALCVHVETYLQLVRSRLRHNQRYGSHRREQGFLFSQLGKLKASTRSLYDSGWRSRQAKNPSWGECGEYGREGRFGGKGGQQVGSAFSFSSDNERIKGLYGNYNLWSWLRYWHLDSADYVNILLIDKGYYDYDFTEPPKPKPKLKKKTTREVSSMLARFGFKTKLHDVEKEKPMTAEEMQRIAMEEEGEFQN